jgi:hypothetical protein
MWATGGVEHGEAGPGASRLDGVAAIDDGVRPVRIRSSLGVSVAEGSSDDFASV